MTDERVPEVETSESATERGPTEQTANGRASQTRRSFLGGSGKKALYLTPIVLSLSARRAMAATKHSTP
ncbi:MAG: hypothetical protein JXQ73_19535 [Phycisphaerae bacterium]|nr:hypothetical protein [Phycisphaerae bacterium]